MTGTTHEHTGPAGAPDFEVTIEQVFKNAPLSGVARAEDGMLLEWQVIPESVLYARRIGRASLAIADRIEEYLESEAHTSKELAERRDRIAEDQGGDAHSYRHLSPWGQRAVDRIIELEDKLAAPEGATS